MERRLAAILAADIAGFSRLIGLDEEGTLAAQQIHRRELIDPRLLEFGGRIANTAGDSLLVEFSSAIKAVQCAVAIQEGMAERNAGVPEDRWIRYRMGINLGDVVVDGGDIFGDGVNIASRLEGLSEPGGICISDIVHQTVLDRFDEQFRDMGNQRVKNISRMIRVWQWTLNGPRERQLSNHALRQQVQFCTSADGTKIAYADIGEGAPLLRAPMWQSHLEYEWQTPFRRPLLDELARRCRLVRFDQRGNGLSDWEVDRINPDAMMEDMRAVVNATGLERFALWGHSQGAALAIQYAAEHPEQVTCLILSGGFLKGRALRGDADAERLYNVGRTMIAEGWGLPDPMYRHFFTANLIPDAPRDVAECFDELQRISTNADIATLIWEMSNFNDVEALALQVRSPTLVVHATGDRMAPIAEGRKIARTIPGARFLELPGENHMLLEHERAFGIFVEETAKFIDANS
jgi:class 3 adenylate cyclase/pimeloyl-ACP methyl ester carboxylesterase